MGAIKLFEQDGHTYTLVEGLASGEMIPSNQVLIHNANEGILLDPGGHRVHYDLLNEIAAVMPINQLKYLFYSHQDPDIVSAVNAWLMMTEADAYISKLWVRFVPHYGIDESMLDRLKPIPDEGMRFKLGNTEIYMLAAHFMHSPGNVHVYDPISKILFTSDLGATVVQDYVEVTDFDHHIQFMEGFQRRYMPTSVANRQWAAMVRNLEIEKIVPQHGAIFPNPEICQQFIDWVESQPGAAESMKHVYTIPAPI